MVMIEYSEWDEVADGINLTAEVRAITTFDSALAVVKKLFPDEGVQAQDNIAGALCLRVKNEIK